MYFNTGCQKHERLKRAGPRQSDVQRETENKSPDML